MSSCPDTPAGRGRCRGTVRGKVVAVGEHIRNSVSACSEHMHAHAVYLDDADRSHRQRVVCSGIHGLKLWRCGLLQSCNSFGAFAKSAGKESLSEAVFCFSRASATWGNCCETVCFGLGALAIVSDMPTMSWSPSLGPLSPKALKLNPPPPPPQKKNDPEQPSYTTKLKLWRPLLSGPAMRGAGRGGADQAAHRDACDGRGLHLPPGRQEPGLGLVWGMKFMIVHDSS